MSLNVFIDTNIFLSFYSYTKDDIAKLEKIIGLLKSQRLILYLPEQVEHEFWRNREAKIQETLKKFQDYTIQNSIPRLMSHYSEVKEYSENIDKLKHIHQKLVETSMKDAAAQTLPADNLFKEVMSEAKKILITEDTKKLARWRSERNDPPGKPGSLGDRLNWEGLIETIANDSDLHVVTVDKDYFSLIDTTKPHPALVSEWKNAKNGDLFIYDHLTYFLKQHFSEIEIPESDRTKQAAIQELIASDTFSSTHIAIKKLSTFINLISDTEVDKIVRAALSNNQINLIGTDPDVKKFYKSILIDRLKNYTEEEVEQLKTIFELSD